MDLFGPGLIVLKNNEYQISDLLDIMRKLRDPDTGCPWDLQQDFSSIAPYTIEEAYEVADAIERGNLDDLRDELGDLLFQVVFHARMASEKKHFDFNDVVAGLCEKMIRRHPHVFSGDATKDLEGQQRQWEDDKEKERIEKGECSLMDGIPGGLAELQRAVKLQKRAARTGFDWKSSQPVLDKLQEEIQELIEVMGENAQTRVEEEMGDVLFTVTNLARQLKINPASALRKANSKFERRFRSLEELAGTRETLDQLGLEEMEQLWHQVKKIEMRDSGHE